MAGTDTRNSPTMSCPPTQTTPLRFDEAWYQRVIELHGYHRLGVRPIDFTLPGANVQSLATRWLCHDDGDRFAELVQANHETCIVTTGIGLSGDPHIGTLSQMLRAIFLQRCGLRVQFVLGDLDSYNARGKSLTELVERAEQYRLFIEALGFDSSAGILRTQRRHPEILETAYLIARCLNDKDFRDAKEDLSDLYEHHGVHDGMSFPIKQSILLMVADFVHLGWRDHATGVLVSLGIEEHMYVRLARAVVQRMGLGFMVAGMYSPLVNGLGGFPKMSKSIPESSIYVSEDPASIRRKIVDEESPFTHPGDSVVLQMMAATSLDAEYRLPEWGAVAAAGGAAWRALKSNFADELVELCSRWSA